MFALIGLLCTDPASLDTCQMRYWKVPLPTLETCQQVGEAQLGSVTPYGVVLGYKCEPAGENA